MNSWIITTQEFLLSLIDTGQYIHITDGRRQYRLHEIDWMTDMYYTAWTNHYRWSWWKWRVKDADIVKKKYFFIDYDIRSCVLKETWELLSTKDLFACMEEIESQLEWLYTQRKYIVYSGNWFHIYYEIKNKAYGPKEYRAAVNEIYQSAPLYEYIDRSTSNIANLARLPWYINTKCQKKYNIDEPQYCKVIKQQDVWSSFDLDELYKDIAKRKDIELKKKKRKSKDTLQTKSEIDDIYMPDLVLRYKWIELAPNWREFKWRDGKNMWMFYERDTNIIIYNGSPHLTGEVQWYNPFTFIKYEVLWSKYSHPRDVFEQLKKDWFLSD